MFLQNYYLFQPIAFGLGTEVGKVHFCNIPLLLNSIEAKVLMKREAVEGGN